MDILIHALSAVIVMQFAGFLVWQPILFTLLPDLLAFIPMLLHFVIVRKPWSSYFEQNSWFATWYKTTHSLVYAVAITLIAYLINPLVGIYMMFYVLHILLDGISHGSENSIGGFMFYPFSTFKLTFFPHWKDKHYRAIIYVTTTILLLIGYILQAY